MTKENRVPREALREIGLRMRHIRNSLSLQQDTMANDLKINRPVLSNIENGKTPPSFEVILALYEKHDINIHYILDGKGEMFRSSASAIKVNGDENQLNADDVAFFKYYFHSPIVRLETLSKFSMLMAREGELIERDVTRKKIKKDSKDK